MKKQRNWAAVAAWFRKKAGVHQDQMLKKDARQIRRKMKIKFKKVVGKITPSMFDEDF